MTNTIEGGCRCGRIRYRLKADKLPNTYACHCRDCQTWSGSAFSLQAVVAETAFELTTPDGSRTSRQRACPVCFTRIYNTNTARPGLAVVRAGTLDRSDELKIVAHIWTKRKLEGIDIPANLPTWPEAAPPADFIAALMRD
jgi:hypothetical protein